MMKNVLTSFVVLLSMVGLSAQASIGPMNYQGRLLNDQGVPVTGSYNFTVGIWDAAAAGTLKYEEVHSGVSVNDGVYSFLVGTQTKTGGDSEWDINLWNTNPIYLEITVNSETLSPRQRIAAAPYAYQANLALTTNNALALGGKSAEEYGNILQEICESNKGKWLATVERCAGNAADLSSSLWSDLDPSNDYGNLDLIKANFNGANFSGVNFSGSLIKDADITSANFANGNFTGATFDGATFSTVPDLTNANLSNANILNMDLTGVNLSSATLTQVSAAKLSGCPTVPAGWECVEHSVNAGVYYLIGPNANYSDTSAGLIPRFGTDNFLDIDNFGSVTDVSNSDFSGVYTDLTFDTLDMTSTTFDFAQLVGTIFQSNDLTNATFLNGIQDWATYNQSDMTDTWFDYAVISNSTFEWNGMINTSFYGAFISSTTFDSINWGSAYHDGIDPYIDFRKASLRNIEFEVSLLSESDFSDAFLANVFFYSTVMNANTLLYFVDARFDDVYFIGSQTAIWADFTGAGLYNVDFSNEDFSDSWFDNAYIFNTQFSGTLLWNVSFDGADIEFTSFEGADLTGSTFVGTTFNSVIWQDATCPDGFVVLDELIENCEDGHL